MCRLDRSKDKRKSERWEEKEEGIVGTTFKNQTERDNIAAYLTMFANPPKGVRGDPVANCSSATLSDYY